mmetsp:Transcript_14407/g.39341  ORF Transcript_14407/g.39341 Transcript_14407/m.39341 type:complete len:232 (-) Transcript_14407:1680-2375(-)
MHTIDGLSVSGRVPGGIHQNHAICSRHSQADAADLHTEADAEVVGIFLLEFRQLQVSLAGVDAPIDTQELEPQNSQHAALYQVKHPRALREDEAPVSPSLQLGKQHREHTKLARKEGGSLHRGRYQGTQLVQHLLAILSINNFLLWLGSPGGLRSRRSALHGIGSPLVELFRWQTEKRMVAQLLQQRYRPKSLHATLRLTSGTAHDFTVKKALVELSLRLSDVQPQNDVRL